MKISMRHIVIALVAMLPLIGAEYHGTVKFNNLPMPGTIVTATQGDKKLSAVTAENGAFSFSDLSDGTWILEVEAAVFQPIKQDVVSGGGLPSPAFDMKMLPPSIRSSTSLAKSKTTWAPRWRTSGTIGSSS
jgi:hypothetical protein